MYTQLGVLTKGTIIEVCFVNRESLLHSDNVQDLDQHADFLPFAGERLRIGDGDCRWKSRVGKVGASHCKPISSSVTVAYIDQLQNNPEMDGCLNAVLLV